MSRVSRNGGDVPVERPLDVIPSIRMKLSVLVVGAVIVAALVSSLGFRLGWPVWLRPIVSISIALVIMRIVARGMTSPLRAMASAAKSMSAGDYSRRVVTTSRDEVGQLATAFNQMSADLADLDRQRRDLVANAAHELRTPIAVLQVMFENASDGVTELDDDFLLTINEHVRRLGNLVDQLLSLSQLDSPEGPFHPEPVDVHDVAASVVADAVRRAPDASTEHPGQVTLDAPRPIVHVCDPLMLRRMLMNLVDNALRHGAPPVVVRLSRVGRVLRIEVTDNGPGIAFEDAHRVFERFQRLGAARKGTGTGLGMSIVAGIAHRHGGTVRIADHRAGQSPPGCTVTVELPEVTT